MNFPNIKANKLFFVPESTQVVFDWIDRHLPEDRSHLYTAAMMMYNIMARSINYLHEDYLDEIHERIGDGSHYGDEDEEHDPFIANLHYRNEEIRL